MSVLLEAKDLACNYGRHNVFHDMNFKIHSGEIFCLLGPNGCGKTTLLDCVLGLNFPSSGDVLLDGVSVSQYRRYNLAQKIAFVPQLHQASFPYTVREVVLMGRAAYTSTFGSPTEEDDIACEAALQKVGMLSYADKPYHNLSGGELKLVLLARAIGQKAPLLLLDEPTAHLDFRNELLFLEMMITLCREEGIALLMATHSPDQAFFMEEKGLNVTAAMYAKGTICYIGKPSEIITPDTIQDVYGVRARISMENNDDGTVSRKISLLHTV
ncbi:MAG: ABC transporter ATP-binding protein [Firmicutes bacterium]|nr:ABC transporter ATP-binding protein [Bacillota bacterium]